MTTTDLDTLSINTIRGLAMDEVQKALVSTPEHLSQVARERVAAAREQAVS